MNYKELNGKSIRDGFNKFHQENLHVFTAFETEALQAISNGKTKLSAKNIINVIRWNGNLKTTDTAPRINDAYQAYYARLFADKYPQYKNVFEFRKLRNEEPGPYMGVEENGQLRFL